ncbi:MAG: DUF120 domain-containing protein, partial [Candidatus Korarchaeum sp.]|nr:DUF120 domain-containing protein [Candidatus Korarchaeum sp.]
MEVVKADPSVTHLIVSLALLGAAKKPVKARDLSKLMSTSRATLSRWVSRAEELGFVKSATSKRTQYVMLSEKSVKLLRSIGESIEGIGWGDKVVIGEIFSGMGEGAYYMSKRGYLDGFIKIVGYKPFPGTLNLKLSYEDAVKVGEWRMKVVPRVITGFSEEGRTFGDVEVYPVMINSEVSALSVFPRRRHYGYDV